MMSSLRFAVVVLALVACKKEEPPPAESPPETPAAETPPEPTPPAEPAPAEPPSEPTAAGDSPCREATEPLEVGATNVAVETLSENTGIRISARVGDELKHLECTREGFGGERFSHAEVQEARIGDQDVWLVKETATSMVSAAGSENGEQQEWTVPIAWVFTKDLTYVGQSWDDTPDSAIALENGVLTVGAHRLTITNGALAPAAPPAP
jgi:hypothetical protein